MAERRRIARFLVSTGDFLRMPKSAQALYFHLVIQANDEGRMDPICVAGMVHASPDDLKILAAKGYIEYLSKSIAYITHWRLHNAETRKEGEQHG